MRKREERAQRRVCRSDYMYSDRVTIKEVAWEVMEAAYNKVSSNGTLPANARQIMYAARPEILAQADKSTFGDSYFTQTLLPDYIAEHGCSWDVVYDARGHFNEPHTKREVALGTIDVRNYFATRITDGDDNEPDGQLKLAYPTKGPANRFSAVLFIEKEGFHPLFEQVELGKKWDIDSYNALCSELVPKVADRSRGSDLMGHAEIENATATAPDGAVIGREVENFLCF